MYVLAGSCYQLQAMSGKQAHAPVNFVGFQLVSYGLVVGSPCLQFGLLDEGSYGWIQGFSSLLVMIFSLLNITHVLF